MPREVETGRFKAKTDKGKEYIIVQYQGNISASSLDNTYDDKVIVGLGKLATSTGLRVNYINPTTFKIVETNEIVRKV